MEIWKKIKEFENYEVSNFGNVRNVESGEILKATLNTWGYPCVTLCMKNKRKNKTVHRLVAEAFIVNPNNFPEVNHKDENKHNNCVDNLEWVTKKVNMNYGTRTKRASESRFKKVNQYSVNGELIRVWNSLKEAEESGFKHSAVSECCYGERKTHHGYCWEWAV